MQAIDELQKSLRHLEEAEQQLRAQACDDYRQNILREAITSLRYVLGLCKRDTRDKEKEEPCKP